MKVGFCLVWENHGSFILLAEVHVAHFGVDVLGMVVVVTSRPREQPESFGGILHCVSLTCRQFSHHLSVQKRPKHM